MTDAARFEATGMPDRDWWDVLWPDPAAVLAQVGIASGQRVVDLCCGDGVFTVPLARLTGAQTVAIDLDTELMSSARRAAAEAGVDQIEWIQGDAMRLAELVPASVDGVFMANTFHGVPDKPALARAVAAVLEPGGRFVIVNWWPRPREETTVLGQPRGPREAMRFSPEQVAGWIEPAGFVLEGVEEVGPYHYGAVFVRSQEGRRPTSASDKSASSSSRS